MKHFIRPIIAASLAIIPAVTEAANVTPLGMFTVAEYTPAGGAAQTIDDAATHVAISNLTTGAYGRSNYVNAQAYQNSNRVSRQSVSAFWVDGKTGNNEYEGTTDGIFELRNNSAVGEQAYYDFVLSGMSIEIKNGYGDAGNPFSSNVDGAAGVRLVFEISMFGGAAGANKVVYNAGYEFWTYGNPGGNGASSMVGQTNKLSGTPTPILGFGGFVEGFRVNLSDVSGTVGLGALDAGEYMNVVVQTKVQLIGSNYEPEFNVTFGDPNGASAFRFVPGQPSAVPLPAAGWMLLAGFGALGALRRKKH